MFIHTCGIHGKVIELGPNEAMLVLIPQLVVGHLALVLEQEHFGARFGAGPSHVQHHGRLLLRPDVEVLRRSAENMNNGESAWQISSRSRLFVCFMIVNTL